jgi:hypothetical protein
MDLSLKYSKTSKGAKTVLAKSRGLSANCMLVLAAIDGKTTAAAIQAKLQLNEEKFTQAITQLLDGAYIQVVEDFGPSIFDLKSAIEVSEISTEEFMELALPEDTDVKTQEQIEAEARARAYAEEQARKEAQARAQEEAERKLLLVTDILAKSSDKIDIEKLAESRPVGVKPVQSPNPPPGIPTVSDKPVFHPDAEINPSSLDFTQSTPGPEATNKRTSNKPLSHASVDTIAEDQMRKQAAESARLAEIREHEEIEQRKEFEAQAQREAENRARQEAKRKEEAEAEERARRKAEEKARKDEERRAHKEAVAARKQAEQEARKEAKARAKAEAERKAKAEAERRAEEKAAAEAKAREIAERKAIEKAEARAQKAAEAEAKAEAARKGREEARIRNEALAVEKAIAKEEARRQAEARAIVRAEAWSRYRATAIVMGTTGARKLLSAGRPLLISLAAITVVLLLLLQFVSLIMWSQPIEKLITASIGEPVRIRDLRASAWPKPHLILEEVAIGSLGDITAREVLVYPAILSLWHDKKTIDTIAIDGLVISHESLLRPVNWLTKTQQQQKFEVSDIAFKEVSIKIPEMEVPSFNASISLNESGAFETATLSANNINVDIAPAGSGLAVSIEAQDWQLPIGVPLVFDTLSAKGTVADQQLTLNSIEGMLYGGSMKAHMHANWGNEWRAAGNVELAKIDLGQASPDISELVHLKGRLYAKADISASGDRPDLLMANPSIQAQFEAEQGEIGGLDLARAAAGRQQVGGVTRYEQFSGNWVLKDKHYQLSQLALLAGSMTAHGDISISPQQDLSGKVQTRLDLNSRQLQGRFSLSGKLGNVRISR